MTINQQMFMCAVEEMSFSKAAEKSFVTQQCLSNHIKRLEKSCGTKLFHRTPQLTLTEAGRILYQSYIQIRDIEETTAHKLQQNPENVHGIIRIGTHLNRARIFMLEPFIRFHQVYPNIQLNVVSIHTAVTEEVLSENRVDIVLAANGPYAPSTKREAVGQERIVFLASPKLLKEKIPDWNFARTSISKKELSIFPLTGASNSSSMTLTLNHSMRYEGYELKYLLLIDDNAAQIEFCCAGQAMMFCPMNQLIGREALIENGNPEKLQLLTLEGYDDLMSIALYTSANRNLPDYINVFCSYIQKYYQEEIEKVHALFRVEIVRDRLHT